MDKLKEKEDKAVGLFYNKIENDKNNKQGNILLKCPVSIGGDQILYKGMEIHKKTLGLKIFLLLSI